MTSERKWTIAELAKEYDDAEDEVGSLRVALGKAERRWGAVSRAMQKWMRRENKHRIVVGKWLFRLVTDQYGEDRDKLMREPFDVIER